MFYEILAASENLPELYNYFLNKKKFTNGMDLRNSFMHGTNPNSEDELINMYYILIRIIVLFLFKGAWWLWD